MYSNGKGVPQDDKTAVKWFRLAAEQGFAKSQLALGLITFMGKGVPQDYVPEGAVSGKVWVRGIAEQVGLIRWDKLLRQIAYLGLVYVWQ